MCVVVVQDEPAREFLRAGTDIQDLDVLDIRALGAVGHDLGDHDRVGRGNSVTQRVEGAIRIGTIDGTIAVVVDRVRAVRLDRRRVSAVGGAAALGLRTLAGPVRAGTEGVDDEGRARAEEISHRLELSRSVTHRLIRVGVDVRREDRFERVEIGRGGCEGKGTRHQVVIGLVVLRLEDRVVAQNSLGDMAVVVRYPENR